MKKKIIHPLGKLGQSNRRFRTWLELEVRVKFGHSEIDGGCLWGRKGRAKAQSGKVEGIITGWVRRSMAPRKLNTQMYWSQGYWIKPH